jgi:hypothetical protein
VSRGRSIAHKRVGEYSKDFLMPRPASGLPPPTLPTILALPVDPPAFRRRPKAHLEAGGKACADVAPSAIVPTIISRIARL